MNLIKNSDFLILLPAAIPCAGGLFVLLIQVSLPKARSFLCYWSSLFFLFSTFFLLVISLGWDGGIFFDFSTAVFPPLLNSLFSAYEKGNTAFAGQINWGKYEAMYSLAIVSLSLIIMVMARKTLSRLGLNLIEVYQMMLFSISGLILFISSHNLILLFIALELASLPVFVLVGWDRKLKSCNEASIKYFLLSAFSIAFILLGIAFVYGACGDVDFSTISQTFKQVNFNVSYLKAGLTLLIFGLGFKVALFPLHAWVADVYEGSITIVTAFMAALIKIASVGMIFKLLKTFAPFLSIDVATIESPIYLILIILSVTSMFYGNITALTQKNLKRLFAYSSIAHAGYMASLFPLAFSEQYADEASSALWFYVVAYAINSTLAFGVINFLELSGRSDEGHEKRGAMIRLDSLKGLSEKYPYATFLLSISVFSFAGIPPLVGFYGKFYILKTLLNAKMYTLTIFLSVNSLIAVFYYARIFFYSYCLETDGTINSQNLRPTRNLFGFSAGASVSLLGLAILVLGLFSGWFLEQIVR